jgi:diguanylate cyclase (GGDEF)-like protein
MQFQLTSIFFNDNIITYDNLIHIIKEYIMALAESTYDSLTGLLRRNAFEEGLADALAQAQAEQTPLTVAMLDVDNFLNINNQLGHVGGDMVLKDIANVLKLVGEGVILARYGGDEFAFIFPNTEREQAFLKLEQVRAAVADKSTYSDGETSVEVRLTISAGVAAFPIDGADTNELMRKADGATYRAKASGRNKIALAYEERMAPKTSHYTLTQLERLSALAKEQDVGEAVLLREALDDLLVKYQHGFLQKDRG